LSLACSLLAGLLVNSNFFLLAIIISTIQAVWFLARERSVTSFPSQLRLAYWLLMIVLFVPPLQSLYWVPALGTLGACRT
jgi:hypothetical protein